MSKKKNNTTIIDDGNLRRYDSVYGPIISRKGGPSAAQHANLTSMEGNRNYNREWGYSSHVGSLIRESLRKYRSLFNFDFHSRLVGDVLDICHADITHPMGKRSIDIKNNGRRLENYIISKIPLRDLTSIEPDYQISENRQNILINIPAFAPMDKTFFPKGTGSFKLLFNAGTISNFVFNEATKNYFPEKDKSVSQNQYAESQRFNSQDLIEGFTLEINLNEAPDPDHALLLSFGIRFFNIMPDESNKNKEWAAMKIAKVA